MKMIYFSFVRQVTRALTGWETTWSPSCQVRAVRNGKEVKGSYADAQGSR